MLSMLRDDLASDTFGSNSDQFLLSKYLYDDPSIRDMSLQHDSYKCQVFVGRTTVAWPTKRREDEANNYVGSKFEQGDVLREVCPVKCRPKEHKDWKMC